MLIDLMITPAYAQAAPAGPFGSDLMAFLPMIAIFVVFYFLLIRPQQKKAKEAKAMLDALQKGDEVVTAGGILGRITKTRRAVRDRRDRRQHRDHRAAGGGCAAAAQGHDQGAVTAAGMPRARRAIPSVRTTTIGPDPAPHPAASAPPLPPAP